VLHGHLIGAGVITAQCSTSVLKSLAFRMRKLITAAHSLLAL